MYPLNGFKFVHHINVYFKRKAAIVRLKKKNKKIRESLCGVLVALSEYIYTDKFHRGQNDHTIVYLFYRRDKNKINYRAI